MHYVHKNNGTCSTKVEFDIENGNIYNVKYEGGCNGNLQAIASLVEGLPASEVVKRVNGIKCGLKPTSCSDQLAKAIQEALEKQQ